MKRGPEEGQSEGAECEGVAQAGGDDASGDGEDEGGTEDDEPEPDPEPEPESSSKLSMCGSVCSSPGSC